MLPGNALKLKRIFSWCPFCTFTAKHPCHRIISRAFFHFRSDPAVGRDSCSWKSLIALYASHFSKPTKSNFVIANKSFYTQFQIMFLQKWFQS